MIAIIEIMNMPRYLIKKNRLVNRKRGKNNTKNISKNVLLNIPSTPMRRRDTLENVSTNGIALDVTIGSIQTGVHLRTVIEMESKLQYARFATQDLLIVTN